MQSASAPVSFQLTQEPTLWFPHATLVIQAEHLLFRVLPGIMAAKSPVFQDMLAFPQLENGGTVEGCSLVRSVAQEASIPSFFEAWPAEVDFTVVAGILRLSQKYHVDPLKKRALLHFSERCSSDLMEDGEEDWSSHSFRRKSSQGNLDRLDSPGSTRRLLLVSLKRARKWRDFRHWSFLACAI
ncbi:hypothetical protein DFH09DRAFT_1375561 [Mycena vulgaris]|nr:hypothetical protein DFH09DRAFT_1375561 [Mycena vulgaris]